MYASEATICMSLYIYVCMYVCMYVCVCVRKTHKEREKHNIIYYTISLIVHICFVTISNIMFIR